MPICGPRSRTVPSILVSASPVLSSTTRWPVNPLDYPIIFSPPRRLASVSAWREHIPFAMFLVDLLRPRVFVELGTHTGNSYCAFCQAVDELQLTTRCYAVDTWQGDSHTGEYGPEILSDLRAHHDQLYSSFSRLIQTTFDDALECFNDGTIDLLHVDGYHTYEAVKHDFETWLPKLSERGVVLLHDINTRRDGYGVWQFWEEVNGEFLSLELVHAHGLGVLAVGRAVTPGLSGLLEAPPETVAAVRDFFFGVGYQLRLQFQLAAAEDQLRETQRALKKAQAAADAHGRDRDEAQGALREGEERAAAESVRLRARIGGLRQRNARLAGALDEARSENERLRSS